MKKILLSTFAASMLLTTSTMAEVNTTKSSKQVIHKATKDATENANNRKVKLIQEALNSLKLTTDALKNLDEKKSGEAKKNIELALGKLEAILSVKDSPKLLPIQNSMLIKNFIGGTKEVEVVLRNVKKLLDNGKIQEAGELLTTVQSEIDITTVNLPMVSYPDALKLAVKYLIEEKPNKAKEVIVLALNTFTEVHKVIPIPLITTLELATVASDIAKDDKDQALKHLISAHEELNKAEIMGYLSKSTTTYKELHALIENVEKEVKGPNKAEKLFEDLGKKLNEFKSKILSSDDKEDESV